MPDKIKMPDIKMGDVKQYIEKGKAWLDTILKKFNIGKGGKTQSLSLSIKAKKEACYTACIICAITMCLSGWITYSAWEKNEELTMKTQDLKDLNHYDLKTFMNADIMGTEKDNLPTSIADMAELYTVSQNDKERLQNELDFKTSIYSEFLRNLFLPSLNIWKDPYTKEIDLSILGKKYLDKNPYQDIVLLSQWGSIIKDSGKDVGNNEITNIQIGDIEELDNGYFYIPISVSFTSDSKRAFLLLVDKLSLTSNKTNIGLLNDFAYYIFDAIRDEKMDVIQELIKEYGVEKPDNQDEKIFNNYIISRYLYNWIQGPDDEPCRLIDESIIDTTIRNSTICGTKTTSECYFSFRDKYRTIPGLAYAIGLESLTNKVLALKLFLKEIPPLITIEGFTFDKGMGVTDQVISLDNIESYEGTINFKIYGRGISEEETDEITTQLAESCFGEGTENKLDVQGTLNPIQKAIEQITNGQIDVERMGNLLELREILEAEQAEFDELSPYNKMIRKFEYYRMLKNMGLCSK